MRPAAPRCLYGTIRRAKQPLFEEWTRPLNKKQQKVMNKAAVYYGPQYHGTMKRDVRNILAVYETLPAEQKKNAELRERVEEALKKHAGERYQLGDISPSTYGLELHSIPPEFVIFDTHYPYGIPPNEDIPSSIAYDADRLANILHNEGFMLAPPSPPMDQRMANPLGFLSAPTLQILGPQPFTLSLPNPAIVRTAKLLGAYFGLSETIHSTFRSVYIWARSHGFDRELKPMTLALAVVTFCQLEKNLPSLTERRAEPFSSWKEHPQIWVPFRAEVQKNESRKLVLRRVEKRVAVDTSFAEKPNGAVRARGISGMLGGFFGFWGDSPTWFSDHLASPRSGRLIPREFEYLGSMSTRGETRRTIPDVLKKPDDLGLTSPDVGDDFALDPMVQPKIWAYQPLVLPDPFLTTYNHAARISPRRWSSFWNACLTARQTITTSSPFVKILGNNYPSARDLPRRGGWVPPLPTSAASPTVPNLPQESSPQTAASPPPPPFNGATKGKLQRELLPHLVGPVSRTSGSRAYHTSSRDTSSPAALEVRQDTEEVPPTNPDDPLNLARDYPMLVDTVNPERLNQRLEALQSVREAVQAKYGKRYDVEAFGSTQYGVSSNTSDVDMVITDSNNPLGFEPTLNLKKLPDIYNVKKLRRVFFGREFRNVSTIPSAKVPIVRLRHSTSLIQCDINVNDRLGLLNTQMIATYMKHVPLAAPMLRFVKQWAKPLRLNMPSSHRGPVTFSTYAFALMIIGFLQHKGYAPNLQAGFEPLPDNAATPGEVFWCKASKSLDTPRVMCDARWNHHAEGWTPAADYREKSVEKHFEEFFQYWAREHDYANDVVDIKLGGIVKADVRRSSIISSRAQQKLVDEELAEQMEADEEEMVALTEDAELPEDDSTTVEVTEPEPEIAPGAEPQVTRFRAKVTRPDDATSKFLISPLCVVDPFIRNKNVTQSIGKSAIESLRANAHSVATMLRMGVPLQQIVRSPKIVKAQDEVKGFLKSTEGTKLRKSWKNKMVKKATKAKKGVEKAERAAQGKKTTRERSETNLDMLEATVARF